MYEYILMAMLIFLIILATNIVTYKHFSKCLEAELLKARFNGWRECEKMAMERAKEHGYNMDKFWPDIFQ